MNVNTLANIAKNLGIENSDNLRDDIVSEYTETIDSLNTIDESVIVKNIEMIPVYKINEWFFNKKKEQEKEPEVEEVKYSCPTESEYKKMISVLKRILSKSEYKDFKKAIKIEKYEDGDSNYVSIAKFDITPLKVTTDTYDEKFMKPFVNLCNDLKKEAKKLDLDIDASGTNSGYIDIVNNTKVLKESYAIDLDSLKYVVESEQCTLEDAVQKIKDINYISNLSEMYCVIPKNCSRTMSIEKFNTLYSTLNNAGIGLVSESELNANDFVNELSHKDWKDVGKNYKYTDRFKFGTTIKNYIDITKNLFINPTKTGNFEKIHPQLLNIVNRCKTIEECKHLKRDLSAAKTQLIKLKQNKPEIAKQINSHIKWMETDYKDAINNKIKELNNKK